MSWEPIANVVPQEFISGVPASGYYYKFYQSGTTTPTSMATDSTGATTLDKCQLNSDGRPINGSGAVFIPHIDRSYKLALYANSTDADANTFANAVYVLDALTVPGSGLGTSSSAKYTETIAATSDGQSLFTLASSTYSPGTDNIVVYYNGSHIEASEISETSATSFTLNTSSMIKTGDRLSVRIDERLTSSDILGAGSVTYTPAGSGAVTTTADAKLKESVSVKDFGAVGDGVTDDSAAIQAALDVHDNVVAPPGNFKLNSTVYVKSRGKTFLGAGVGETTFTVAAGVEGIVVGNDATSSETNHDMTVGDFKITGGAYGLTVGGNGTGPKAMLGEIRNIQITGATTSGLRLISPQGTAFHNVDCEANAIGMIGEDLQAVTNSQFFNCRFYNNTSHGVHLKSGWGVRFYGCGFESNGGWGALLEKNTLTFTNLMFIANWFEANTSGSASSDDITITDLSFIKNECNGTSGTYHFDLLADNICMLSNRFLSPTTNAFRIQNASTNYNVSGNTGTISAIPSSRNGFHNSQDGDVDCSSIAATSATFNNTAGSNSISCPTGDINLDDGLVRVTQTSTATDGATIIQGDAVSSVGSFVRLNCGSDVDRVGLKFVVNGVISSYLWVDDTGQPRWKTSLPINDTDGTAM